MSIERCQACSCQIDTDADDGCYVDDPRHSIPPHADLILCRVCREGWGDDRGPPDLEMLEIDYEQARDRYLNALRENRHEPAR